MLHIVLNALTPVARFMQCNFKMDRCKFHSIGFVGFVTKQMHTSRFLTEFTSCNGKMPCNSLPCWVISWPDKVHHFFPSHQKSKDDQSYSFQQINGGSKLCFSERHQDILSCNPLSFLTQNINSVVCRFSFVS